jgi:hypothetical protein
VNFAFKPRGRHCGCCWGSEPWTPPKVLAYRARLIRYLLKGPRSDTLSRILHRGGPHINEVCSPKFMIMIVSRIVASTLFTVLDSKVLAIPNSKPMAVLIFGVPQIVRQRSRRITDYQEQPIEISLWPERNYPKYTSIMPRHTIRHRYTFFFLKKKLFIE